MTYRQSTGELLDANGVVIGVGYSGSPAGKNNPAMQNVVDVGPIPQGTYHVGAGQPATYGYSATPRYPATL